MKITFEGNKEEFAGLVNLAVSEKIEQEIEAFEKIDTDHIIRGLGLLADAQEAGKLTILFSDSKKQDDQRSDQCDESENDLFSEDAQ